MKLKTLTRTIVSLTAASAIGALSQPANATDYKLDPAHSFIQFRTAHLGFSTLVGRFNDVSGEFSVDESNPGSAQISVLIKTDTVDTNHAERDKHLRSEDFLEVDKFPEATFKSTSFKANGDGGGTMEGDLTLHGVTKPITFAVTKIGEGDDPWGGYRSGYSATVTLKRADFGIDYDLGPASEEIDMELFVEGIRK